MVLGVVEGFYWSAANAVRGQSGQYTHEQRRDLLDFMASAGGGGAPRLDTYVHTPQLVDTMSPWGRSWK